MQNKKMCILILLTATFFMIIAVTFIMKVENKIEKYEYIVDNSNLESNIAIMVQDSDTKEYLKTDTIPMGKYILNIEKTHCVGRGVVSDYNNKSGTIKFETEAADECYVYFDAYSGAYDKIIKDYTGQGMTVGGGVLYLHDSSLANGANDGSYRYAGADPDNYLCFEGDTCDDKHKYRIIGIFEDNIKVIKMTIAGNKAWNSSNVNTWENSTMDAYLNGEWLTSFAHQDLIEDYDWHVGGHSTNQAIPKVMYGVEIASTPIISRKVGLMYASDYGYASENTYWSTAISAYNGGAMDKDWLFLKTIEWTISRISGTTDRAFYVDSAGYIYRHNSVPSASAVRPCFYLKPSVEIKSGTGTKTDPWIMGM